MTKVNSLSGGRTSSYIAVHYPADHNVFAVVCIDDPACAPKDPAVVRYAQEKLSAFEPEFGPFIATAEDDRTLRAMMDLEQLISRNITWVRGISFDNLIDIGEPTRGGASSYLPSWARRYCTQSMKLLPIFFWWWHNISVRCEMRIGFRFDEFDRMEKFFNYSDPTKFEIPVSCSVRGQRKQQWEEFIWRACRFPLVRDGVTKDHVEAYWQQAKIKGDLFGNERSIEFPAISNCIGCFHKKPETLAAMADIHPEKFNWFARQEEKGKGTWLDSKQTYLDIMERRFDIGREVITEARNNYATCDSGGCTN